MEAKLGGTALVSAGRSTPENHGRLRAAEYRPAVGKCEIAVERVGIMAAEFSWR
jgi:hypothetical protein